MHPILEASNISIPSNAEPAMRILGSKIGVRFANEDSPAFSLLVIFDMLGHLEPIVSAITSYQFDNELIAGYLT